MRVATGHGPGAGAGEAARYELDMASPRRLFASASSLATVVHVVSLAGVVAFWAWLDHGLWFFGDEWDFLVDRGLGYPPASPHGIWFPHNEHWSTLPILAWRALYAVWHLSSYWPYLALLFAVQLALVHLAWRACKRAGAGPWTSTAAVLMLGLLGAGAEDWGWAFQVGFAGSVAFGLAALDLLEHPGPTGLRRSRGLRDGRGLLRRQAQVHTQGQVHHRAWRPPAWQLPTWLPAPGPDLAASCALLASLMCSTVGDAMVVGAAIVAFARLGWRRASQVLWPPVACYAIWFVGVGRLGIAAHSDHFNLSTFTGLPGYVWDGLSTALGRAAGLEPLGTALLVALAAWLAWNAQRFWADHPALIGLCASALAFYVLVGIGRDANGPPDASRYVYVAFALLLPVLAKVLSGARAPAWPPARAAAIALLLLLTLGNVGQARAWASARASLVGSLKNQLFAVGELVAAGAHDVSGPTAAPLPGDPNLQVADIERLERAGLLAHPRLSAVALSNAKAVLALGVWDGLDMTLSRSALFPARFELLSAHFGSEGNRHGSCVSFTPEAISPEMSVELGVPARQRGASIELSVGAEPTAAGARSVQAFFVPRHGPVSNVPVNLAIPASGHGWLDDNQAGSAVVLDWSGTGPLSLCGFGR